MAKAEFLKTYCGNISCNIRHQKEENKPKMYEEKQDQKKEGPTFLPLAQFI